MAEPFDFAKPGTALFAMFGTLYSAYVRGLAHLAAKQGAEAAREFQKIIDRPGLVLADPVGAVARLQLARALVLAGQPEKAKEAYSEFLELWNHADPEIPILQQARAELAKLH